MGLYIGRAPQVLMYIVAKLNYNLIKVVAASGLILFNNIKFVCFINLWEAANFLLQPSTS